MFGKDHADLQRLVSRDKFLRAAKLREKEIDLPEIGTVRIRELTVSQRVEYMKYMEVGEDGIPHLSKEKLVELHRLIVSMGLLAGDETKNDEAGGQMFPTPDDIPDSMNFDAMDSIAQEILKLSGIVKEVKQADPLPVNITIKSETSATP